MSSGRLERWLLAHEWLEPTGGSENVFEDLSAVLPAARRLCLWNDAPDRFPGVEETWLGRTPLRRSKALSLPLMPAAWRWVELAGVDRVLVSSHAVAHHLAARAARRGIPAFAYVHSPARYVWSPELDTRGERPVARLGRPLLRRWDRAAADPRVHYAANSRFVQDRIERAWGVPAEVINPPVDVARVRASLGEPLSAADAETLAGLPERFVLGASRLVPYKRVEDAIAVGEILDLPVVVAGSGPDAARLAGIAKAARVPVHFLGRVSDQLLWSTYAAASLFVFTAIEDFGIMPVEAMAVGTPVLANRLGGAAESVLQIGGGTLATPTDVGDLAEAARVAVSVDMSGTAEAVDFYSRANFRRRTANWLGVDREDEP